MRFYTGSDEYDFQNSPNKPNGGRGWASWFLEEGYKVYIVDETTRARSAWNPAGNFPQSTFQHGIRLATLYRCPQLSLMAPSSTAHAMAWRKPIITSNAVDYGI